MEGWGGQRFAGLTVISLTLPRQCNSLKEDETPQSLPWPQKRGYGTHKITPITRGSADVPGEANGPQKDMVQPGQASGRGAPRVQPRAQKPSIRYPANSSVDPQRSVQGHTTDAQKMRLNVCWLPGTFSAIITQDSHARHMRHEGHFPHFTDEAAEVLITQ